MFLYRPFCKYLCPLGAIYALFRVSLYKLRVDESRCTRCGDCVKNCPADAISAGFRNKKLEK